MTDRGETVRDEEGGAVFEQRGDRVLNEFLCLCVDRSGCFVEHEDARVGKDRTSKGNELLFTGES